MGGDGSGSSSSKEPFLPDLNKTPTEEDLEDPREKKKREIQDSILQKKKKKKDRLKKSFYKK